MRSVSNGPKLATCDLPLSISYPTSSVEELLPDSPVTAQLAQLALFVRSRKTLFANVVHGLPLLLALEDFDSLEKEVLQADLELVDRVERRSFESRLPVRISAVGLENAVEKKNLLLGLDRSVGNVAVLRGATVLQEVSRCTVKLSHSHYLLRRLRRALHLLQREHAIELLLARRALVASL